MNKADPSDAAPLRLQEFLPYRFSIISELISRLLAGQYEREFGLTIAEWRVMAVLGEREFLSTQGVIEATEMDRVRVSRAVIRLADKGLVARKTQAKDKRAQVLSLSRRGASIYRQITPLARALQAELVAKLEADELKTLDRILIKLRERADELAARSPGWSATAG